MKKIQILKWPIFLISTHEGGIQISSYSVLAKEGKTSPPEHAKTHGYRAKHTYRYYPSANAYSDVERKSYFYPEGNNWRVGVSLPDNLNVKLGTYVTIGMDSGKPYGQLKKRRSGQRKNGEILTSDQGLISDTINYQVLLCSVIPARSEML